MEIAEAKLLDLMGETGIRYTIPSFQRAYSWEAEQCDELWRDIERAARARRTHFLGTLIYTDDPQEQNGTGGISREVIDGQQRLTTITLIILALAEHLEGHNGTLFGAGAKDLASIFLGTDGHSKLSLSRADNATFEALVQGDSLPKRPSKRLMENLANFKSKMAIEGFDAAELWRGLESLTVMAVKLDDRSKAPDVFESFNSKGVPLVTADMVRNFLLLAESRREQIRLYETYWTSIADSFGDDPGSLKLNNAILGWLAVRFRGVRKFGDAHAFSIFKSFCEDEYDGTTDALLEELYAFCLVWAENYRYHAVKKYKSADWARIGRKTRVSGRSRKPLDHEESREYYQKHFGVDPQW